MSDPRLDDEPGLPRAKRRWSLWTLLAPAALVVVVMLMFNAVGSSCALRDCDKEDTKADAKDSGGKTVKSVTVKKNADGTEVRYYRVKSGDSPAAIAAKFDLTEEQLQACNPGRLTDSYSIQPGQKLRVERKVCLERAKKAGVVPEGEGE